MLTLGQAARETGLSKPTISKAISKGRLSATRNEQGEYQIDPAELFRVYPPTSKPTVSDLHEETPVNTDGLHRELELLRDERARERAQLEATIADLRSERDRLLKLVDEQAGTVRLLTHQTASGPRRRFNWLLAVMIALLVTLVAYVGSLLVLTPEPAKPIATPQKSPPPAPSEIWKPDSNGG